MVTQTYRQRVAAAVRRAVPDANDSLIDRVIATIGERDANQKSIAEFLDDSLLEAAGEMFAGAIDRAAAVALASIQEKEAREAETQRADAEEQATAERGGLDAATFAALDPQRRLAIAHGAKDAERQARRRSEADALLIAKVEAGEGTPEERLTYARLRENVVSSDADRRRRRVAAGVVSAADLPEGFESLPQQLKLSTIDAIAERKRRAFDQAEAKQTGYEPARLARMTNAVNLRRIISGFEHHWNMNGLRYDERERLLAQKSDLEGQLAKLEAGQ
jgi:hypothetical protein